MAEIDILKKIEEAKLVGRGGAGFPVHQKWLAVREAEAERKYVICNISEKEPGVFKDFHILKNHLETVFRGIELAMDYVGTKEGYLNFNSEYYEKLKKPVEVLIAEFKKRGYKLHVFLEEPSYIGGEETALMNAIEGQRVQPRLKPPYPAQKGLFGFPTLVHNVETLYNIACSADGTYEGKRFYSLSGAIPNEGVYHLPEAWTIQQILEETKNVPDVGYFVQAGGGASGAVYNSDQAKSEQVPGAGAIIVYRLDEDPREVLLKWLSFYDNESCGKCTPCREGTYQLYKMVKESDEIPWDRMKPILDVLEQTSFCPLGWFVPVPIKSYMENVLNQ